MITAEQQVRWFEQQLAQGGPSQPEPDWLEQVREDARRAASRLPALNRKQEAWRYTSIENLLKHSFQSANDSLDLTVEDISDGLLPAMNAYRLVFVNGRYRASLPSLESEPFPDGVTLGSLSAACIRDAGLLAAWFGKTANPVEHIFTALNTALIDDGLFIHVGPHVELERPVEVIYITTELENTCLVPTRNLILLESGAGATLVERFISQGPSMYFHNNLTEISVGEGASLSHYRVQDESRNAWHLSSLYLSQGSHSVYRGVTLAFGAAWSRTDYHAGLTQASAHCLLNGFYAVGDRQLTDFHLNVQHVAPACTSREKFKGLLHGKGRAVFDGHILVEKQAQYSDAHLANDNLMLVRDAEVDTKPQLEIYADNVKCSHGTTVGQLDPQQVFYLRSRGIDARAARRLLSQGFAAEIIETIDVVELREHITDKLTGILNTALDADGELRNGY